MEFEKGKKFLTGASVENKRPVYEPPKIITYTSEQILEQIGPAMACSGTPCGIENG